MVNTLFKLAVAIAVISSLLGEGSVEAADTFFLLGDDGVIHESTGFAPTTVATFYDGPDNYDFQGGQCHHDGSTCFMAAVGDVVEINPDTAAASAVASPPWGSTEILRAVAFNDDIAIVASDDSTMYEASTPDGTYTAVSFPGSTSPAAIHDVVCGETKCFGCGANSYFYEYDGTSWQAITTLARRVQL